MAVITKELCEQRLREYLDAEEALITGAQSYTVNGRACTKADLGKIQAGIKLWNDRLAGCESNGGKAFRGVRVRGIVPHG